MELKAKLCTQVMDCAECTSIKAILIKAQLPWAGHVVRMDNHHTVCPVNCCVEELAAGKRKQGCLCKQ